MQTNHVFLGMSCARCQFISAERVQGVLIAEIDAASPAAKAGLQVGDVILEIDHQAVKGPEHALELSRGIRQEGVIMRVWTGRRSRYFLVESEQPNRSQPCPSP